MNWIYKNEKSTLVMWGSTLWEPGQEKSVAFPVPLETGLTLVTPGDGPSMVKFCEQFTMTMGETKIIDVPFAKYIDLTIGCLGGDGANVFFNNESNISMPIDASHGFAQVIAWESAARIILKSLGDTEISIGITEALRC